MRHFSTANERIGLWLRHQVGATLVEYALLLALIVIVALTAVTLTGEKVSESLGCSQIEIANPGIRKVVAEKIKNGDTLDALEEKFSECV